MALRRSHTVGLAAYLEIKGRLQRPVCGAIHNVVYCPRLQDRHRHGTRPGRSQGKSFLSACEASCSSFRGYNYGASTRDSSRRRDHLTRRHWKIRAAVQVGGTTAAMSARHQPSGAIPRPLLTILRPLNWCAGGLFQPALQGRSRHHASPPRSTAAIAKSRGSRNAVCCAVEKGEGGVFN